MKMTNQEYEAYVKTISPPSRLGRNTLMAFLFGGAFCVLGEGIRQIFLHCSFDIKAAAAYTSVLLVFLSAVLTAFHVYDDLAKIGGAGTLVPITGFANAMVAPAIEFKSEGWITGLAVKMFTISGPVLVYGTAAAALYGLVYWIIQRFS